MRKEKKKQKMLIHTSETRRAQWLENHLQTAEAAKFEPEKD